MSQVKIKKVLFGAVASMVIIATPLAVVISCGEEKTEENKKPLNVVIPKATEQKKRSYEDIVKDALSDARKHYRMEVIDPITISTSKNKLAAPKDALATARRKSGSSETWYENSIFASDFSGEIEKFNYKTVDVAGDKLLKESLKQHKRIVITDMTKKKGEVRKIPGKIFLLKSGQGYFKYAIIISENSTKAQPKNNKVQPKIKKPQVKVVPKFVAPVIVVEEYKKELKDRKKALEALVKDTTKTKIFVFDNGHGIKPVFGNTKNEFISLIKSKLEKYGFSNTPSRRGSIYKQGYASRTGFKLYTSKQDFSTVKEAANAWEKNADKFIREVEVSKVIVQMISDLRVEFSASNLTESFDSLDKAEKAISLSKVIPVANQATSDALVAKYITNAATNQNTIIFEKNEFQKGSRSFALSVRSTKAVSGKPFGYFVTIGMMLGKKEHIDSKINSSTLVNGVEKIAFVKVGSSHYKSLGFTFIQVGGKWYFAPDYVKSIFPGMTFKKSSYFSYKLSTIDAKYQDLLDYTKQIIQIPTTTPISPITTQGIDSIY